MHERERERTLPNSLYSLHNLLKRNGEGLKLKSTDLIPFTVYIILHNLLKRNGEGLKLKSTGQGDKLNKSKISLPDRLTLYATG